MRSPDADEHAMEGAAEFVGCLTRTPWRMRPRMGVVDEDAVEYAAEVAAF